MKSGGGIQLKIAVDAREVDAKLKALPLAIAKKVIRRAMRAGAKIVADQAKTTAPVDTGDLVKAIKVRAAKRTRKKRISVNAIIGEGFFKGKTFYAAFQEFGHRIGKRPKRKRVDNAVLQNRWKAMANAARGLSQTGKARDRQRARELVYQARRERETAEKAIAEPEGRRWWEGKHFMRRALESTASAVIARTTQMIRDGIERLAAQKAASVKAAAGGAE